MWAVGASSSTLLLNHLLGFLDAGDPAALLQPDFELRLVFICKLVKAGQEQRANRGGFWGFALCSSPTQRVVSCSERGITEGTERTNMEQIASGRSIKKRSKSCVLCS